MISFSFASSKSPPMAVGKRGRPDRILELRGSQFRPCPAPPIADTSMWGGSVPTGRFLDR